MNKRIKNILICAPFKQIELWHLTMMNVFRVLWYVSKEDVSLFDKKSNLVVKCLIRIRVWRENGTLSDKITAQTNNTQSLSNSSNFNLKLIITDQTT